MFVMDITVHVSASVLSLTVSPTYLYITLLYIIAMMWKSVQPSFMSLYFKIKGGKWEKDAVIYKHKWKYGMAWYVFFSTVSTLLGKFSSNFYK